MATPAPVTCASVELIEAMAGIAPRLVSQAQEVTDTNACERRISKDWADEFVPAFAWGKNGEGAILCTREVDCPRCLVAMDAAYEGQVFIPPRPAATIAP